MLVGVSLRLRWACPCEREPEHLSGFLAICFLPQRNAWSVLCPLCRWAVGSWLLLQFFMSLDTMPFYSLVSVPQFFGSLPPTLTPQPGVFSKRCPHEGLYLLSVEPHTPWTVGALLPPSCSRPCCSASVRLQTLETVPQAQKLPDSVWVLATFMDLGSVFSYVRAGRPGTRVSLYGAPFATFCT